MSGLVRFDRLRWDFLRTGAALGIAAAIGLLATPAKAAPPVWTARFNGGSQDAPARPSSLQRDSGGPTVGSNTVAVDALGNIYVAGTVTLDAANGQDFLVEKYDAAGNLVWYRTLDGGSKFADTATCLAISSDAVYVTGESCKTGSGDCAPDFLTVKYDSVSGAQQWAKLADGPAQTRDYKPCVVVDGLGTPFVAGTTREEPAVEILTIKYNPATGAESWRSLAFLGNTCCQEMVAAIGVGADGHVVVSGPGSTPAPPSFFSGLVTVKFDTGNGAPLWAHAADAFGYANPYAIAFDANSNPVVVGRASVFTPDPMYFALKYYASNGALFWLKNVNYATDADEAAHDVAVDGEGNVYVTGRVGGAAYRSLTVKYAALNGDELWAHSFGTGLGPDHYVPTALAYSSAVDRVVVAGYHQDASGRDFFVGSLSPVTGGSAPLQVLTDVLPADYAVDVATDAAGNVIVAGGSVGGPDLDLMVLKYSPALAEIWRAADPDLETHEVMGSLSLPQFGRKKIAIDSLGSTVVVGSTAATASGASDFLIQKYGPGGNFAWSRTIDGGAGTDFATAVVLGGANDVYVTGWSLGLGTDYDILTLRLNFTTGATVWSQRHNNPANQADVSYSIAIGTDRVFVAGAFATGGKYNFLVLGYPRANGNSPWTASLDFPGGSAAYAVAVGCYDTTIFGDCVEGVYIAGVAINAANPTSGDEFLTARFDAFTGALVTGLTQGSNARGLAIATYGNPSTVVATGRLGEDWMTTASYGSTQIPLWTEIRDFDARDDQAYDVAFDTAGNAFVTGFATKLPARNKQLATVKYDRTTGTELAVARNGPTDEDLTGYAVATDNAGQVYVAGSRFSLADQKNDFLLFQYTNGLALVSADFLGASGSEDQGSALAVERSSGDAVVAGTSFVTAGPGDLLLAKWRAPEHGRFFTTAPCRIYDSRNDPAGPIPGGQTRVISALGFAGNCAWLTPAVKSLAINVTALGATAGGHLKLYPGNIGPPLTSVVNFAAGQTRANNGILSLATNAAGTFAIRAGVPAGQTVHVLVDVAGYFD